MREIIAFMLVVVLGVGQATPMATGCVAEFFERSWAISALSTSSSYFIRMIR